MNDMWKVLLPKPEQQVELCPPLHHLINNTCIPDIECLSSEDGNSHCTLECDNPFLLTNTSTVSSNCLLECRSASELSLNVESNCVIEGDITVNGSVVETTTVTIVGVINVTGDVNIIGQATLKLTSGATLHIDKCLVLDDEAQMIVEVESGMMNGSVLLTFDSSCSSSSSQLSERVIVESKLLTEDLCRDGRPTVKEQEVLGEDGLRRTHFTLLFVPMNGSEECSENAGSELNVLAIAIAVPVVVLAVVVVIVVMSVYQCRKRVVPGSLKLSKFHKN